MIVPNKHLSQVQTLKLHVNLCHNHHHGTITPLQPLESTIPLLKIFLKPNLFILEAAITIYALILILITQNYTDTDVCKSLIQPLFVRQADYLRLPFSFFRTHHSTFFFILGANPYKSEHQQSNSTLTKNV